ncbi:MAG: hypothetical protein AAFQ67_04625, partial [Pseudomonadota bacterium]
MTWGLTSIRSWAVLLVAAMCAQAPSLAAPLSDELEFRTIENVGTAWQVVALDNSYSNAIPVCTYVTVSIASRSALPRVRNISASSFELRIQEFTGGANPTASTTPGTVHCVIAEAGAHTLEDGRRFEAFSVLSDGLNGNAVGWNFNQTEDVSSLISNAYANPITMAGLISANDPQPSAIWTSDCDNRGNRPFNSGQSDGICVSKHIGQINGTRLDETIGVIIAESGTGVSRGIAYRFERGNNSINGIRNNSNTGYSIPGDHDAGVATQLGENGGQGGWATLVGADPLPDGFVRLSIDEEVVAGDTRRSHTNEEVAVFLFDDQRDIDLNVEKTAEVWDPSGLGLYLTPGNDVLYTLTLTNAGGVDIDDDSILLVDRVPDEVAVFNGDLDPTDGVTGAVRFVDDRSQLSFNPATDLAFATGSVRPT